MTAGFWKRRALMPEVPLPQQEHFPGKSRGA
jgi:hypothetical protein